MKIIVIIYRWLHYASVIFRLQRLNEEKLEKLEQMVKKREQDVHQKELHMDNSLRAQQERCRLEERMAYDTKYRELKAFEHQLKGASDKKAEYLNFCLVYC